MARPFEFHRIMCLSDKAYERIILYVKTDYFKNDEYNRFLNIFENRKLGTGNVIPCVAENTAIADCIKRVLKYSEEKEYWVAEHTLAECVYLLNRHKTLDDIFYTNDKRIREVIVYINQHLSEKILLDDLAKRFYIDKYYLCKSFKKNTGYTINRYINYKRILLARELHKNGESLIQASYDAGFNNYTHFYKMYVKQTGQSPRKMD